MNKEIDRDKVHSENPKLPREFVENVVEETKEVERDEHTQYRLGQFQPTPDQLKEIASGCADALANATEEELGEFVEARDEADKSESVQKET